MKAQGIQIFNRFAQSISISRNSLIMSNNANKRIRLSGNFSMSTSTTSSIALNLLDRSEFETMNREMHEYDEKREEIIKRSRVILKSSKQSIFALHRGDFEGASKLLKEAEAVVPELAAMSDESPSLRYGALSSALEEYAEAKCFAQFLATHKLEKLADLPVTLTKEEYLGGVIDFTGELMRYAVVKATARDIDEVKKCQEMVEAISMELIQFDFRNGPLRKKFDSVKYNLRKLENTLYELSLVTSTGLRLQQHDEDIPSTSEQNKEENS